MDIVLERIMSLLPVTAEGKIVRGAKKDFALNIGYDSGDIISMWLKGTSSSYLGKLHEISDKYNVSVEWLKGETDKKEKPLTVDGEELNYSDLELLEAIRKADAKDLKAIRVILGIE